MAKKPKTKKVPLIGAAIAGGARQPRAQAILDEDRLRPIWSFQKIDRSGPWCWRAMDGTTLIDVLAHLGAVESLSWTELRQQGSHAVDVIMLCKPAQDRMMDLGHEVVDALFSVRITGEKRVWALKRGHVLQILWWDPNHEVCPSRLKHT